MQRIGARDRRPAGQPGQAEDRVENGALGEVLLAPRQQADRRMNIIRMKKAKAST